ncbi:DUF2490 domain-containing protein [Mucilaginibacter conchicola]|uniref:DUF2490 domain-containing protein n=1 Tax=Mucilaginibacter conchicola TaxID=2303333 RepID=A0A372NXI0_9SPHI|nr:DUF2490 domain-containing protein [Mucilaginibacter conchicola]RFZ94828.1 DUF2490 domain-containing protein [Mucilaginibacter conchicola]
MTRQISALVFFSFFATLGYGQSVNNRGWFFLSNTHSLSKKIDLLTDVQLRSANQFEYFNTLLLRGAFSYNFNKKRSLALGYAYKGDWEHQQSKIIYSPENRIYEQYLYNFKAGKTELNFRLRLEQRFLKEDDRSFFSQRVRAFISAQIPLVADTGFTRGLFTGVQDELFFNAQNNANVNNSLFDQNRSFISLGYRVSKKIDAEFGYMYWLQKEKEGITRTNVWQLMLTTKF